MQIRPYSPELLSQALELSKRSDSTPRTAETWGGNQLKAVLAFQDDKPIGIIPLEPRIFKVSASRYVNALWVSGAHVDEPYRSGGIGTAMDAGIAKFYPDADAIFAYRQDETSRAYQWYIKRGYQPLCSILSFKKEAAKAVTNISYHIYETQKDMESQGKSLLGLFEKTAGHSGGYPKRTVSFWAHTREFHYYKNFYKYFLLTIEEQGDLCAYAFVGETSIRDGIKRLDILELISPLEDQILQKVFDAVFDLARKAKLQQVRIQCAQTDPLINQVKAMGFTLRWQTNILGKALKPAAVNEKAAREWKYFQIDYI